MDYSSRTIERLSLVASILGLIQGSLWFLGGLFSICTYNNIFDLNVDDGSISYYIFRIIASEDDRTIIIFMFLYAVLSITLSVFSALLIKETFLATSATLGLTVYVSWSFNIVILSLIDIVLACFLGRDLSDLVYQTANPPLNLLDAYTIILLVSMRGILFWIINIVLAGYITVFGFQLSRARNSRPNDVIRAFQESSGPWHTNLSNNPLARLSRKENGKQTTNSYQNLIGAENLTFNSDIFRKQQNYEERLANIGKPGKRTPLKSPSPVNVLPPVPPPIPNGKLNDSTHAIETFSNVADVNGDEKFGHEIEKIFDTISMENKNFDSNPDYPYIPSPDYTPVGSPVLKPKSEEHADKNGGTKLTLF